MNERHRSLFVVRGDREATLVDAQAIVGSLGRVLFVSAASEPGAVAPSATRRLLGQAFDAVVLDLHEGLDCDVLGQCHGFVWGGGALVLRLPPEGSEPLGQDRFAVSPYSAADVGHRMWRRLLEKARHVATPRPPHPIRDVRGTPEQRGVVGSLARLLGGAEPGYAVLIADRGRGKSSALGMALASIVSSSLRCAVTADRRESALEVLRFAPHAEYRDPAALLRADALDVIVVDEAAQLPVPMLRAIALAHPSARVAFASTAHGYEGTGRGFVLRFVDWLRALGRPVAELALDEPIRWSAGDPLEAFVFDLLALDAEPATIESAHDVLRDVRHELLEPERLAGDEQLLRQLFGLLVHAHYRTTPSDLHRLLDAPNLRVHALLHGEHVVAANLIALEGGLDARQCEQIARGAGRVRGHALADTLISHAGRAEAGQLAMVRSVRIATHPRLRRKGLAARLTEEVHRAYAPDLYGTLFGATPELLRFRRSLGYELVRVGISRGARTGEPAAVMCRAISARARALVDELRGELARDLSSQLDLMSGDLPLGAKLVAALREGLGPAVPLDDDAAITIVRSYAFGPRPFETCASAVARFVALHDEHLSTLAASEAALLRARVLGRSPWDEAARVAGYPSVPAAMRALRRAVRALWLHVGLS